MAHLSTGFTFKVLEMLLHPWHVLFIFIRNLFFRSLFVRIFYSFFFFFLSEHI